MLLLQLNYHCLSFLHLLFVTLDFIFMRFVLHWRATYASVKNIAAFKLNLELLLQIRIECEAFGCSIAQHSFEFLGLTQFHLVKSSVDTRDKAFIFESYCVFNGLQLW